MTAHDALDDGVATADEPDPRDTRSIAERIDAADRLAYRVAGIAEIIVDAHRAGQQIPREALDMLVTRSDELRAAINAVRS